MKVAKFGGSSVADSDQIRKVGKIIREDKRRKLIVVSAPGKRFEDDEKVTDLLIKAGEAYMQNRPYDFILEKIFKRFSTIIQDLSLSKVFFDDIKNSIIDALKQVSHSYLDPIKAMGEDSSAKIMSAYLNKIGIFASYINPKDAGIYVSDEPGNARVLPESYEKIYKLRNKEGVLVVPGFFGYTKNDKIITFSRGGSDITGSIVAAGIHATLYENFTDVDSVYVVNPEFVKNPRTIETLTYKEMRELSYAGFSVFHDEALIPAFRASIPVCIKNTNNPSAKGTLIVSEKDPTDQCVVGIASDRGFCSLYVSKYLMNREIGFGRKLFGILEDEHISFEHAPSGIDDLSVIIRETELTEKKERKIIKRIKEELQADTVYITRNLALIMVVGEGMKHTIGMAQKATTALVEANVNIEMINQGSSEVSMMFGIQERHLKRAVQSLYNKYFQESLLKSTD